MSSQAITQAIILLIVLAWIAFQFACLVVGWANYTDCSYNVPSFLAVSAGLWLYGIIRVFSNFASIALAKLRKQADVQKNYHPDDDREEGTGGYFALGPETRRKFENSGSNLILIQEFLRHCVIAMDLVEWLYLSGIVAYGVIQYSKLNSDNCTLLIRHITMGQLVISGGCLILFIISCTWNYIVFRKHVRAVLSS